jgi:hypothetical protein
MGTLTAEEEEEAARRRSTSFRIVLRWKRIYFLWAVKGSKGIGNLSSISDSQPGPGTWKLCWDHRSSTNRTETEIPNSDFDLRIQFTRTRRTGRTRMWVLSSCPAVISLCWSSWGRREGWNPIMRCFFFLWVSVGFQLSARECESVAQNWCKQDFRTMSCCWLRMNQEVSSSTAAFTVCLNAQSNSRVWSLGGSSTVCLLDEEDEACSSSKEFLHSNRSDQILLENYECLRI